MKHLFLPYSLAVIAKEKGFDEQTLMYYLEKDNLQDGELNHGGKRYWISNSYIKSMRDKKAFLNVCSAPLYQQIIDWFFDKHHIVIEPVFTEGKYWIVWIVINYNKTHVGSGNFTFFSNKKQFHNEFEGWKEKYEALNKAIEEAFKLI